MIYVHLTMEVNLVKFNIYPNELEGTQSRTLWFLRFFFKPRYYHQRGIICIINCFINSIARIPYVSSKIVESIFLLCYSAMVGESLFSSFDYALRRFSEEAPCNF